MALFGMISAVSGFIKIRYLLDKAVIDNMVFRCHYRITTAILFVCCIIVTANNLIGKFDINFKFKHFPYLTNLVIKPENEEHV